MTIRFWMLILCAFYPVSGLLAQNATGGKSRYEEQCAPCHGGDGNGGEFGPAIVSRLPMHDNDDLAALIRAGIPTGGMPVFHFDERELRELVEYLRVLRPPRLGDPAAPVKIKVHTVDGSTLDGVAVNRSPAELQLRTADGRVHLLRKTGDRYRPVTSQVDWSRYDGQYSGNRYSTLTQITKDNVARLTPQWVFPMPDVSPLEVTPVVVEGIMYVTSVNQCLALDAGSGRRIWQYQRRRTKVLTGNALGGINRGVAAAADRVFMVTDNAHIIALNRFTGALLWDTEMADSRQNYSATAAPLAMGNLVVSGVAGGDSGARGFVTALDQSTGKEVWRFWTAPKPGEPGSETWRGNTIQHPGAVTWMTGTYDPELELIYWPTGNPGSDLNGDKREGDNLYANSIVALDRQTGKLKWYYQFTPHDLWDWDAQEPPVLVDTTWQGQPRKLLLHADRNGFFYVLDRTNGKLLLAKPFVQRITWAKEIGADGRPVRNSHQEPSPEGTRVCPSLIGATNWWSTSFNPATGLYYVQTLESCAVFVKRTVAWESGKGYNGGTTKQAPDDLPQKSLKARVRIDGEGHQVLAESHQVLWSIGSGEHGKSYVVARGNALFQSPLSSYTASSKWDLSPGYANGTFRDFTRPVSGSCLFCHASSSALPPTTISCERCHGPGELHALRRTPKSIVNPARLPPMLRDDVCNSCHLGGEIRVQRAGKSESDFHPGTRFGAVVAILSVPPNARPGGLDAVGQVTQLKQSRCWKASEGKLGCITCHNPHRDDMAPRPQRSTEAVVWDAMICSLVPLRPRAGEPHHPRMTVSLATCPELP